MQFANSSCKKGRQISFCNSTKIFWAPLANCQKVMEHRMQIKIKKELRAVLNTAKKAKI
jgi:hypothetical protein